MLNVLRVAPGAMAVKDLLHIAEWFGLPGNGVRVALTRLVGAGLIENDERGFYRMAPATDPHREHLEEWRLGDARLRRWNGHWLQLWLPRKAERSARKASRRALTLLGFAEGLEGLWVRPDNFAVSTDELRERVQRLGLEAGARLWVASDVDPELDTRWRSHLWPLEQLQRGYDETLKQLQRSRARLDRVPIEQAAVEAFTTGGEAIRVLVTDPWLPRELMPTDTRTELAHSMQEYDKAGRKLWAKLLGGKHAPAHLTLATGT